MAYKIIPIFIPHIGCPHDCSFCNQKKIAGEITDVSGRDVSNTLRHYLNSTAASEARIEVAYFGGSFTGLPFEKQRELLAPAFKAKKEGRIRDIRISTRPDYINDEALRFLEQQGVTVIELGVQSTDAGVLMLNRRGHTAEDVKSAAAQIKRRDFTLGLQMMVGLLGDNAAATIQTAADIAKLKPDFVRVYPTIVIKDTYLERLYLEESFIPLSLEMAVDLCVDILNLFSKAQIPIIRMGLQSTDEIAPGKSIVAGPFHPAFRELVEAENYRRLIEKELGGMASPAKGVLNITCNDRECSKVSGVKQSNKLYFKEKYGFTRVIIKGEKYVDKGRAIVEILK